MYDIQKMSMKQTFVFPVPGFQLIFQDKNINLNRELNPKHLSFRTSMQTTIQFRLEYLNYTLGSNAVVVCMPTWKSSEL